MKKQRVSAKAWRRPLGFHIRLGNAFEFGWSLDEDKDPHYSEALRDFKARLPGKHNG